MIAALRALYSRLPIIRELRRTASACEALSHTQWRLLLEATNRCEERLLTLERYADARNLNRHEFQVFSQFGEDGMLAEIFRRIGSPTRSFLEIGIGDGLQNNTAYLMLLGWSGHWIDGNERAVELCRRRLREQIGRDAVVAHHAVVDSANVLEITQSLGVPADLDLLSLDVDRNTYYVWEALAALRPRVAVIEYNPALPADVDWKVPYAADRVWNRSIFYGASLKALELLGRRLGYSLVGCNLAGVNAFFVRNELCGDRFETPYTAEHHYQPFRPFLERRKGFPVAFGDGPQE